MLSAWLNAAALPTCSASAIAFSPQFRTSSRIAHQAEVRQRAVGDGEFGVGRQAAASRERRSPGARARMLRRCCRSSRAGGPASAGRCPRGAGRQAGDGCAAPPCERLSPPYRPVSVHSRLCASSMSARRPASACAVAQGERIKPRRLAVRTAGGRRVARGARRKRRDRIDQRRPFGVMNPPRQRKVIVVAQRGEHRRVQASDAADPATAAPLRAPVRGETRSRRHARPVPLAGRHGNALGEVRGRSTLTARLRIWLGDTLTSSTSARAAEGSCASRARTASDTDGGTPCRFPSARSSVRGRTGCRVWPRTGPVGDRPLRAASVATASAESRSIASRVVVRPAVRRARDAADGPPRVRRFGR